MSSLFLLCSFHQYPLGQKFWDFYFLVYASSIGWLKKRVQDEYDGYFVSYKPITLSCILFMFNEMKFIHCHSCVMFVMKSMSMCND